MRERERAEDYSRLVLQLSHLVDEDRKMPRWCRPTFRVGWEVVDPGQTPNLTTTFSAQAFHKRERERESRHKKALQTGRPQPTAPSYGDARPHSTTSLTRWLQGRLRAKVVNEKGFTNESTREQNCVHNTDVCDAGISAYNQSSCISSSFSSSSTTSGTPLYRGSA